MKEVQKLRGSILVLALLAASGPAADVSALPGESSVAAQAATLVAHYPFDGNADDASGNGYHGVVHGPTLTTGKYGQAYQFDGTDDYVSVAWDAPIQGENQSFTLAAWVKTDDVTGEHWVLGDDSGWYHFLFGLHRGNLYIRWRYGSAWTDYSLDSFQTVAGDFTHVAATYDAATRHVRLYVDGALAVADTTSLPLGIQDLSTLHIGKGRTADPSEYFDGVIDDVRIYDGPLTDAEIRALVGDAVVPLTLHGNVADQTIYLSWAVNATLPAASTWQIAYQGPAGNPPSPVTGVISAARAYTLTDLTNDTGYTVRLNAVLGGTPFLTGTMSVTPTTAPQHPRLFFSGQDLLGLREAGRTTHAEIRRPILEYATSLLGSPPPTYPGADYSALTQAANRLIPLAFAYAVTSDERFSDLTREHLLEYASWPYWGGDSEPGDRDLTLSSMLQADALAYDWVYDRLSEADRATIRAALADHAQEQYEAALGPYNSSWRNWWWASYAQNHWHVNNTAVGMAALALEGEDGRTATWLDHVVGQMAINNYVLDGIHDGTWHEGVYYQNMMFTLSMPFYYNLQRLKGQDIFPDAYFENYILWKLYNYLPGTRQYALSYSSFFVDWGWNAGDHQNVLRLLARQYRSGYAEWLAQQIIAADGRYATVYHAPNYVFEFLYYDPTVMPVAPTALPHDRTFSDLEGVIWRTGWGSDDVVFGLRTGPYGGRFLYETYLDNGYPFNLVTGDELNVGHNQPDANTFYLYKGGTDLSSELPIRAREETTQLHNTLLVDGQDQYFANWHNRIYEDTDARLEAVYGTPGFSYLAADATNRYREKNDDGPGSPGDWVLSEFTRYVLFAKPDYLVMVDDIRSATTHRYDWVCHTAEGGAITVEGDWVKGAANGEDVLGVKVLAPSGFAYETGISTHEYTSHEKPYVRVRPATNVADTRFVTLLYPTDEASWGSKPAVSLLGDTGQAVGVRIALDGTQDHLIRYGTEESVTVGEYVLAGAVASAFKDSGGNLTRLFLGNGRTVSDSGGARVLIESQRAITVEAIYSGSALALYGEDLYGLKIYGPDVDVDRVTINDQEAVATKIGGYVYVFGEKGLVLTGAPGDRTIYLDWTVNAYLPPTSTWRITYYSETITSALTETDPLSTTRACTLTGLTNYEWYTVTLHAMLNDTSFLSDTVHVMPTNLFVYLPITVKDG